MMMHDDDVALLACFACLLACLQTLGNEEPFSTYYNVFNVQMYLHVGIIISSSSLSVRPSDDDDA